MGFLKNTLSKRIIFICLGGTLKIFGDELNCSILYETLLLSNKDTAEWIVKQMLLRYGLKHDNPKKYCLVQVESSFARFFSFSFENEGFSR